MPARRQKPHANRENCRKFRLKIQIVKVKRFSYIGSNIKNTKIQKLNLRGKG